MRVDVVIGVDKLRNTAYAVRFYLIENKVVACTIAGDILDKKNATLKSDLEKVRGFSLSLLECVERQLKEIC